MAASDYVICDMWLFPLGVSNFSYHLYILSPVVVSHTEPSCYWPQAFISEPSYYWPHALLTSPVITGLVLNYWAQFLLASGLFVAWPTSCCAFITEPSSYWPQAYLWPGPHHVAHLLLSPVITGLRLICGLAHIMLLCCAFMTEPSYYWPQAYLWPGPHHVIMLRLLI